MVISSLVAKRCVSADQPLRVITQERSISETRVARGKGWEIKVALTRQSLVRGRDG